MGIEPTLVAWEATVLPLNYTRFSPGAPASIGSQPYRANQSCILTEAAETDSLRSPVPQSAAFLP